MKLSVLITILILCSSCLQIANTTGSASGGSASLSTQACIPPPHIEDHPPPLPPPPPPPPQQVHPKPVVVDKKPRPHVPSKVSNSRTVSCYFKCTR